MTDDVKNAPTPGPWQVKHLPSVSYVFSKTKLANVYSEAYGDVENQHANAMLVAASPDLLEAAKAVIGFCPSHGSMEFEMALDELRAAILKATGAKQ